MASNKWLSRAAFAGTFALTASFTPEEITKQSGDNN
jgi:hypothetical protein